MAAVTPIETPTTDELREFYEQMDRTSGGLGVLNVFKVMAHSPALMRSWWGMMVVLFGRLELDPRLRELAILRLFQIKRTAYGFAHHVRFGKEIGLTDEQIGALDRYPESDLLAPLEKLVLQYTDAVTTMDRSSADLASALREHLSEQEVVELTFCIANWNLMAHLLLPLEIELEPAAREFLPEGWEGS